MGKILYDYKSFNDTALSVITQADRFCTEYDRQGYKITLRQLYYRFIATDAFPEDRRDPVSGTKNTERNYKWLGKLVSDARIAGLINWSHLEDRGRESQGGDAGWDSPGDMIETMAERYIISHWDGQPEYVEVWVEKQALEDVISRPASRWNVRYFACKGYVSQSSMHEAAVRLRAQMRAGRNCTIIHLGDHDPSGLDMTRDISDRLRLFRADVDVDRIALNMDQIEELDPPPSPAKITDSRGAGYIAEFHDPDIDESGEARAWELDALEPATLEELVEQSILSRLDMGMYDERVAQEESEKGAIATISRHYDDIQAYIEDQGWD